MKNAESKQLSTAAADSQEGPIRVGAVQIGTCGDDDPKTLPRLIPPCPRCGYCGFIEDADMNIAGACPECNGTGRAPRHNMEITENTVTAIVELHPDSKWKESCMSKLEVALDDNRNPDAATFGNVGDFMEYGKKYEVTISVRITQHNA